MKQENQDRIEAHKKAYEDLVLWIMSQFEKEIKFLLPKAKISVCEWYSQAVKDMIQGASVNIEIKGWFDSETMAFLCNALGSKFFRVTAFPMCRMQIVLKVPISSVTKMAMQCNGMWTPKWRKEDGTEE